MKKILFLLIALSLSISIRINAQENALTHKDSLGLVINKYYDLNLKIFQSGSKIEDIDDLFRLFTDDFSYAHPKYGGVYSREDLYNGYKKNLKNGAYNGKIVKIKIENTIIGLNAVVIEKRFIKRENSQMKEGNTEMTLFEFKDGRISRIFEYW
jgi:ketosteroid isomerase-like protein